MTILSAFLWLGLIVGGYFVTSADRFWGGWMIGMSSLFIYTFLSSLSSALKRKRRRKGQEE